MSYLHTILRAPPAHDTEYLFRHRVDTSQVCQTLLSPAVEPAWTCVGCYKTSSRHYRPSVVSRPSPEDGAGTGP